MKVIPELTVEIEDGECDDGPITVWISEVGLTIRKSSMAISLVHEDFKLISDQLALFQKMRAVASQPDSDPGQIKLDGTMWVGEPPAGFQ